MKIVAAIVGVIGFLLIAGTAGSSDFYEECRAAADCVASEPMSGLQIALQSLIGIILMAIGVLGVTSED